MRYRKIATSSARGLPRSRQHGAGIASLEEIVTNTGLEQTRILAQRNWKVASSFLAELVSLAPSRVPSNLVEEVKQAERAWTIENLLNEAADSDGAVDSDGLRFRLAGAVKQYPGEPALESRLAALDAAAGRAQEDAKRRKGYIEVAALANEFERLEDPALLRNFTERSSALALKYQSDSELVSLANEISGQVGRYERAAKALSLDHIEDCLEECAAVLSKRPKHHLFLGLKRAAEEREISLADEYVGGVAHVRQLLVAAQVAEADRVFAQLEARFPQFEGLAELRAEVAQRRGEYSQLGHQISLAREYEARGHYDEALRLWKGVQEKFPSYPNLGREMDRISAAMGASEVHRQERARECLRQAENCLVKSDVDGAERFFDAASNLFPHDHSLAAFIVGVLDEHARTVFAQKWQEAERVFAIAKRFQPGYVIPGDLAVVLRQKREQAERDSKRLGLLKEIADIESDLDVASKDQLSAFRRTLQRVDLSGSPDKAIRDAAAAVGAKVDQAIEDLAKPPSSRAVPIRAKTQTALMVLPKTRAVSRRQKPVAAPPPAHAASPGLIWLILRLSGVALALGVAAIIFWYTHRQPVKPAYKTAALTKPAVQPVQSPLAMNANGTLVVHANVPGAHILINGAKYSGPLNDAPLGIQLAANSYEVRGTHPGYNDFGPVTVSIGRGSETKLEVLLTPQPTVLEIRGAEPGTMVKIDGKSTADGAIAKGLHLELPAGSHTVEFSRLGFLTKSLVRDLAPGATAVLSGSDVVLESTDAKTIGLETEDWNGVARSNNPAAIEAFLKKYPSGQHADAAQLELDRLSWTRVDQKDPSALRAFLGTHPLGQYSDLARDQLQKLSKPAEQLEWDALDKTNKSALQSFLNRHPSGSYSAPAQAAINEIDRQAEATAARRADDAAWSFVNQGDQHSLEDYLAHFPAGSHSSEAENSLSSLVAASTYSQDSSAILTVLSRFANAWNAKDVRVLGALEWNLDKKAVKAQLAPVREISMRISPVSPPQITGPHATVVCRRQADQVFNDGSELHNPEAIVVYVLSKRNGAWFIEGTR